MATKDKIWGTAGPTAALNTFLQMSPPGEFVATWIGNDWQVFHGFSIIFDALNFGTFGGQMFSFICFPCPKLGLIFWELKAQADGISDDWSVVGVFSAL